MKKKLLFLFICFICQTLFANATISFLLETDYQKHDTCYVSCTIELDSKGRIIYVKDDSVEYTMHIDYTNEPKISFSGTKPGYIKEDCLKNCIIQGTGKNTTINYQNSKWHLENGIFMEYRDGYDRVNGYCRYVKSDNTYLTYYRSEELYHEKLNCFSMEIINLLKSKDTKINQTNAKILLANSLTFFVPLLLFEPENLVTCINTYTASSELKEKNAHYKAENLRTIKGLPWASANGYGINDKISISLSAEGLKGFYLYNGYQSDTKKNLYKDNSRVKKIKLSHPIYKNNKTLEVTLEDSPEKQFISLEKYYFAGDIYGEIDITILEVYPGEKYKDLCIQALIPVYN